VVELSTVELNIRLEARTVLSPGSAQEVVDHALIERAKSDPQAFGRLFETYYLRVLGYTYRCTWNRAVAEDLTSATFLKALRSIHRYDHRARFSAWLYRIATNEVRMHWRARSRAEAAHRRAFETSAPAHVERDETGLEATEAAAEQAAMYAQVRDAVGRLPDRYRTVIMLRYFEGLPCDMVAEVLHRRIGTVKSWLHRGAKRLRDILEQEGAP
jgi:RNA polymerase sigma-70 factor (ECF subfamily)